MAGVGVQSFKDLGWDFFWDKDCTIKVKDDDPFPVSAGEYTYMYLGCVPDRNSDGKIVKTDITSKSHLFIVDLAIVKHNKTGISILGSDTAGESINGSVEEIAVYQGDFDIEEIKSFVRSRKSILGDSNNEYYETKEDAISNGLFCALDFVDRSNLQISRVNETDYSEIHGNVSFDTGLNKSSARIDDGRTFISVNGLLLKNNFAINVKFQSSVDKDFVVMASKGSFDVRYDKAKQSFVIKLSDYMMMKDIEFKSSSVGYLFGSTVDVTLIFKNGHIEVLFNGETVFSEVVPFLLRGMIDIERANKMMSRSGMNGEVRVKTETVRSFTFPRYDYTENERKLILNGNQMSFMSWDMIGENEGIYIETRALYYSRWYTRVNINTDDIWCSVNTWATASRWKNKLYHDQIYRVEFKFNDDVSVDEGMILSPFIYVKPETPIEIEYFEEDF